MGNRGPEILDPTLPAIQGYIGGLAAAACVNPTAFRLDSAPLDASDKQLIELQLFDPETTAFVEYSDAEDGEEEIMGGICVHFFEELGAELSYFFCRPEEQGQGIGLRLMRRALEFIYQEDLLPPYLFVNPENTEVLDLYCAIGFEVQPYDSRYEMPEEWTRLALVGRRELKMAIAHLARGKPVRQTSN